MSNKIKSGQITLILVKVVINLDKNASRRIEANIGSAFYFFESDKYVFVCLVGVTLRQVLNHLKRAFTRFQSERKNRGLCNY